MTLAIKRRIWVTALVAVMAMTLPGVAIAQGSKNAEETATESPNTTEAAIASVGSTLPVLGTGLDVTIASDESGAIESVSLDPSAATQTKEGEHRVVFLMSDGDTEVVVKSAQGIVQTKVKADDPADVSGDGAWSGDVFGTGTITIPYSVTFDGNTPMITVGSITAPTDVTAEIGEPRVKSSDDGDRGFSKVRIELTSGEQDAVLSLVAKAKTNGEGETRAVVSATLLNKDRVDCWFDDDIRDRHRDEWDDDRDDREARWDRNEDEREEREASWDRDHENDREWDRDDRDRDRDRDDRGRDGDRDRDRDDSGRRDRDDD